MFRPIIGRALAAVLMLAAAVGAARAGGAFQNGLPDGAVHKLKELIRNDSHVKCIAFTSTGGVRFNCIAFPPNADKGWVLLAD